MIITYEQLKALDPCEGWLEWFEQNVGQQTADFEWNGPTQGLLLADCRLRTALGWLVAHRVIPMFSMAKADLYRANLRWVDLVQVDL